MGICRCSLASVIFLIVGLTLFKIGIRSKWKQRWKAKKQSYFMVFWHWPESQCSWFPRGGFKGHWCGGRFFLHSTLFSRHFCERNRNVHHPDHGRQPPNSGPNPTKLHQHPHEYLGNGQRRRRYQFSRQSDQNQGHGWIQVSGRPAGVVFHL